VSDQALRTLERAWMSGDAGALVPLLVGHLRRLGPMRADALLPDADFDELLRRALPTVRAAVPHGGPDGEGVEEDEHGRLPQVQVSRVWCWWEEPLFSSNSYAEWDGCLVAELPSGHFLATAGGCDTSGWG
jgi:hypothetical protein